MATPSSDESASAGCAPLPLTEAVNPASAGIDRLGARDIVALIHSEDRRAWEAIDGALDEIASIIDAVVGAFERGGRLLYLGAGTSGRLGVLDASECPPTYSVSPDLVVGLIAGGDTALRSSIEGAEDSIEDGAEAVRAECVGERDVVCGIASSGTTPWVLGGLDEAKRRGAVTALVCCNELGAAARERLAVDHLVPLLVGPEIVTGSTRMKAGTATKMVLNMISTGAMIRWGKVYDNRMVDVRPVNRKLVRRATGLVAEIGRVDEGRAAELLEAADREVKTAIVMARLELSAAAARRQLEAFRGRLRAALGE